MSQHYTRNTISDRKYCSRCKAFTDHHVLGGRIAGCIPCEDRVEAAQAAARSAACDAPAPAVQAPLLFVMEVVDAA